MKKILVRRSIQDQGGIIDPKSLLMAEQAGALMKRQGDLPDRIFCPPLKHSIRTAQAFRKGLDCKRSITPTYGLGDLALFELINSPAYLAGIKDGLPILLAFLFDHSRNGGELTRKLYIAGHQGILQMFSHLQSGQVGVAFIPSPCLELAVTACAPDQVHAVHWKKLSNLEGVALTNLGGKIAVAEKICVQHDAPAE